jgi:chromosomal replication initiator protein
VLDVFNPRWSFDQFIIGDSNRLAHGAALAVAEYPGQAYNPLFLVAPPGLGKTHLLHAIGNYVQAFGGGAKVRYTTVEAFTNHFIRSLNKRSVDAFKQAYRDADVLLIDDVQFLASKVKTEEEFFHTFNAIHESGRQLVLTADRLPSQLEGIADRLRERFEAGLVADIAPPDFSTRLAILRKRAAIDGVRPAQDGVLELIAERVHENVRAIEGALIRVVAYHSLTRQPIDRDLTAHVLDGLRYARPTPGTAGSRQPPLDLVKTLVAQHFGLSVDELVSASRAARVAWPRQLAIHLARELTDTPLTTIGSAFGGRNHATILHACKRVAERRRSDQHAAVEIDELTRSVREGLGDRPC